MNEPASNAKAILRAEHRSLAAVIGTMKTLLAAYEEGARLDYPLWWSMVYYIDAFPDRLHHPKEDRWLFARMRQRCPAAATLLDRLDEQHRSEPAVLGEIRRCLGNCEAGVPDSRALLAQAVNAFAEFSWQHMRLEEQELFPLADTHLSEQDWMDIAAAFQAHEDPLAGVEGADALAARFRDIVSQAPAPWGLGS